MSDVPTREEIEELANRVSTCDPFLDTQSIVDALLVLSRQLEEAKTTCGHCGTLEQWMARAEKAEAERDAARAQVAAMRRAALDGGTSGPGRERSDSHRSLAMSDVPTREEIEALAERLRCIAAISDALEAADALLALYLHLEERCGK